MPKIKNKKERKVKPGNFPPEIVCPDLETLKNIESLEDARNESEMNDFRERFEKFCDSSDLQNILNLQVTCAELAEKMFAAKRYETSYMLDKLENSDAKERNKKPAFFQAIYYELKKRIGSNK